MAKLRMQHYSSGSDLQCYRMNITLRANRHVTLVILSLTASRQWLNSSKRGHLPAPMELVTLWLNQQGIALS